MRKGHRQGTVCGRGEFPELPGAPGLPCLWLQCPASNTGGCWQRKCQQLSASARGGGAPGALRQASACRAWLLDAEPGSTSQQRHEMSSPEQTPFLLEES